MVNLVAPSNPAVKPAGSTQPARAADGKAMEATVALEGLLFDQLLALLMGPNPQPGAEPGKTGSSGAASLGQGQSLPGVEGLKEAVFIPEAGGLPSTSPAEIPDSGGAIPLKARLQVLPAGEAQVLVSKAGNQGANPPLPTLTSESPGLEVSGRKVQVPLSGAAGMDTEQPGARPEPSRQASEPVQAEPGKHLLQAATLPGNKAAPDGLQLLRFRAPLPDGKEVPVSGVSVTTGKAPTATFTSLAGETTVSKTTGQTPTATFTRLAGEITVSETTGQAPTTTFARSAGETVVSSPPEGKPQNQITTPGPLTGPALAQDTAILSSGPLLKGQKALNPGPERQSKAQPALSGANPALVWQRQGEGQPPLPAQAAAHPDNLSWQTFLDQLAGKVRWMQGAGKNEVEVRLEPEHLGKVQLRVISEGNLVSARLVVEDAAVGRWLESNMPQLRQTLEGQGLRFQDIQVNVNCGGNGGGQGHYQGDSGKNGGAFYLPGLEPAAKETPRPVAMRSGGHVVDILA